MTRDGVHFYASRNQVRRSMKEGRKVDERKIRLRSIA